ncbi:MAG: Abi family protein, partial [Prevotella sp.]|nr:Abi family protein [Prevotella sp.]
MSNQPLSTIEKQILLLRHRGMIFPDDHEAKEWLSRISYFRLKYYWRDLLDSETDDYFIEGISFNDVIQRYNFDHQLRLILFDAIEIVEVALRSKIINHMSQADSHGLWYLDYSLFENKNFHEDFV